MRCDDVTVVLAQRQTRLLDSDHGYYSMGVKGNGSQDFRATGIMPTAKTPWRL